MIARAPLALAALAVSLGACSRVPIQAACVRDTLGMPADGGSLVDVWTEGDAPPATLGVVCNVQAPRGARIRVFAGGTMIDGAIAEDEPIELRESLALHAPVDVDALTFNATLPRRLTGTVTAPIPFPRFTIKPVERAGGLDLHVELCPACKATWDGMPLAAGVLSMDYEAMLLDAKTPLVQSEDTLQAVLSVTGPAGSIEGPVIVRLPGEFSNARRRLVETLEKRGEPQPWARAWQKGAGPRAWITIWDPPKPIGGKTALRDVELIAFRKDDSTSLESCGPYTTGSSLSFVNRFRDVQTIEVFEAKTGAPVAKKQFKGGFPRSCDERETITTINGMAIGATIVGTPVDEAAVDAWMASLSTGG